MTERTITFTEDELRRYLINLLDGYKETIANMMIEDIRMMAVLKGCEDGSRDIILSYHVNVPSKERCLKMINE